MRMLQPEPAQSAKRKASELALHHEEQMQDVQAAGLADEVAGLRARLEEETQARQRAESAQEEMRAAKCARLEQSDREAAAVAWRDASGSSAEVVDSDGFMARFLAFRQARSCHLHVPGLLLAALPRRVRACGRPLLPGLHPPRRACVQYVEFMLEVLPTKTAKTKPLRLSVRREELCSDVIGHFGFHEGQCRAFPKQKLFSRTSVVFVDANGDEEEGNDQGGLTVEMYSSFFREVLLRDLGLFEGIADSAGGGSSIGLLPKPDAPAAALEAVGRAICKCATAPKTCLQHSVARADAPQHAARLCAGACLTTSRLAAGSAASSLSTWRTRTNGTPIPCCSHLAPPHTASRVRTPSQARLRHAARGARSARRLRPRACAAVVQAARRAAGGADARVVRRDDWRRH